ncbi:Aerotaxis sensor receptor protein [Methanosarcina barkeri 3]|uniref:Aerotaxis sensor receptor protein n=2 Tax=Methanosarcina barkeri TaxID=2208 RepID=A0A0E3SM91_METBA|nr:Aerotaxis sensor receptor protein [Methanosarcina barkeri 3]
MSTTAVTNNIATKYWVELKAYPSSNTRSLWLYAGNGWRYLSNPSENIETSVQNAFANPDIFQVKVWYSGQKIVGLTVVTK